MGRKNAGRGRAQRRSMKPQRQQRADRRTGQRAFEVEEYRYEERRYEYADRVKPQRYPQPVKDIYLSRQLTTKNTSQELYLDALRSCGVVIGSGTAGSGKTYLAVGAALEKLVAGNIEKIYITRPVVEAGESLGFLPGTFEQKVLPYMMPMLDAIEQFVGVSVAEKLVEAGTIVFVPLAYMRGSTYRNCVIILDESQNTTVTQMKLALTRIGDNCSMFITGDPVQSDLKERGHTEETGLEWAVRKLGGGRSNNIHVEQFSINDTVRSPLMKEVLSLIESPDVVAPKRVQLNEAQSQGYGSGFANPRNRSVLTGG